MSGRPSEFRMASKEALGALRAVAKEVTVSGTVNRIALDVSLNGQDEIVSIRMNDNVLNWSCTCGQQNCGHIATALYWISAEESADINRAPRSSPTPSTRSRFSWPAETEDTETSVRATMKGISLALDDLVTAVVRVGTDAGTRPSVDEAVQRLIDAAPNPLPLGISRWIGLLRSALSRNDYDSVARILDGATRIAEDLKTELDDPNRRKRVISWLGAVLRDSKDVQRMSERNLIEIARERLDGVERSIIERRYLVDLENGEIYREERLQGMSTASLGPCPRLINAGLIVVEQGIPPQRIHLLQYSISAVIPTETWNQLSGWAFRRFDVLNKKYKESLTLFPGLTEPFALIAPTRLDWEQNYVPFDDENRSLPIAMADDPSLGRFFSSVPKIQETAWIAGRLVDAQGTLMLKPLSICILSEGQHSHVRI
jgi:hypothetical protein